MPPPEGVSKANFRLYHEKDKESVQNHKKAVKIWLFCFITMTVIASISLAPLSPSLMVAAILAIAVVCIISGFYRLKLTASNRLPKTPAQSESESSTKLLVGSSPPLSPLPSASPSQSPELPKTPKPPSPFSTK